MWIQYKASWILVVACLILCASCAGDGSDGVSQAEMDRAAQTLQPFKEQLVEALMGALDEGGKENAIRICSEQAPQIAATLSVNGVRMGRTSHKLRNPANAAEPWVEPLLETYLENPTDDQPRAVRLDDTTIGYVEPIYVMSFCLGCHGPRVDQDLARTIEELYPHDEAVGFHADDLRGLFWLTMPATNPADQT